MVEKANADALISAAAVAKAVRAEGFEPVEVDAVPQALTVRYVHHAYGSSDGRVARVVCRNTGTICCEVWSIDYEVKGSFYVDLLRVHEGARRIAHFLRTGVML